MNHALEIAVATVAQQLRSGIPIPFIRQIFAEDDRFADIAPEFDFVLEYAESEIQASWQKRESNWRHRAIDFYESILRSHESKPAEKIRARQAIDSHMEAIEAERRAAADAANAEVDADEAAANEWLEREIARRVAERKN